MIEVQKPPRGWCLIEIPRWCWCWSCHPLWALPRWPPTRSLLSWVGRFPLPVSSDLCRSQGFLGESQLCSDFGFALQRRPGHRGSRGCSSCSGWTLRGGGASRSHPCGTPAMSGCLELWAHATAIKPPALETFSLKLKQQLWGKTHTHTEVTVSFQVNLLDKGKQQNSGKTEYRRHLHVVSWMYERDEPENKDKVKQRWIGKRWLSKQTSPYLLILMWQE